MYTCSIRNILGSTARVEALNPARITPFTTTELDRIVSQITGHISVDITGYSTSITIVTANGNVNSGLSGGVRSPNVTMSFSLADNVPNEPTDIYVSNISLTYRHIVGGIFVSGRFNLSGIFRTMSDIIRALETAGATNIQLMGTYNNTPQITCVNTDTGSVDVIDMTSSEPPTITLIDGDPPYLANVSTTEPTTRGVGDIWFNPSNGQLSVYTE